jgi:hypothetical protein
LSCCWNTSDSRAAFEFDAVYQVNDGGDGGGAAVAEPSGKPEPDPTLKPKSKPVSADVATEVAVAGIGTDVTCANLVAHFEVTSGAVYMRTPAKPMEKADGSIRAETYVLLLLPSKTEADRVVAEFDGKQFQGHTLKIKVIDPPVPIAAKPGIRAKFGDEQVFSKCADARSFMTSSTASLRKKPQTPYR